MSAASHLPENFANAARHELHVLRDREQRLERVVSEMRRRAAMRRRASAGVSPRLTRALSELESELRSVRRHP